LDKLFSTFTRTLSKLPPSKIEQTVVTTVVTSTDPHKTREPRRLWQDPPVTLSRNEFWGYGLAALSNAENQTFTQLIRKVLHATKCITRLDQND